MKRLAVVLAATVLGLAVAPGLARGASSAQELKACDEGAFICAETLDSIGYGGDYTGHDEPSVLYYSGTPGSGNSNQYTLVLPRDPVAQPTQDGQGATWNFQLRPAFWFGMDMCDTESAPEYQHTSCAPGSDANIFDSPDPNAPDYIGHHPGGAFMEMQFYPPGWTAWEQGVSCSPTQWCAALNIDSLSVSQVDGTTQNQQCLTQAGVEPVSFAFVTNSGVPQASPDPTTAFRKPFAATTPDPSKDTFMNPGDTIRLDMHDTAAGFQVVLNDVTSGASGSMTASIANGFRHVLYQPHNSTHSSCHTEPYAYHPMYATSSEHTRLSWTAHGYNVAYSDEIGHFEFCDVVVSGKCKSGGATDATPDGDDAGCFDASESLFVQVSGCIGTDSDYDGSAYLSTAWPGTGSPRPVSAPVLFTSPKFNGNQNYDRVAFETDLPRIEAPDSGGICNRTTGANCVNPPVGAQFYPIFSTGTLGGQCVWQEGGNAIPNTTNAFGGNSTAEFGALLQLAYPLPGGVTLRYNDFRQVLASNPCT